MRGWAEKSGKRRRREKGRTFWCQIERLRGFSKRLNESLIENQRVTLAIQPKKKKKVAQQQSPRMVDGEMTKKNTG